MLPFLKSVHKHIHVRLTTPTHMCNYKQLKTYFSTIFQVIDYKCNLKIEQVNGICKFKVQQRIEYNSLSKNMTL